MKNMKKLLGAMAAIGFSTVAAVNVVACSNSTASNDLTKSFEKSFKTTAADATTQEKWGLSAPTETGFTFTFASIDEATITGLVKPKASTPVTVVSIKATSADFPNATKAAEELAQITKKTADGAVTTKGDTKTVSLVFTLNLFKATEAGKTGANWVDQKTTMEVTVNIDTVSSGTKVNLDTITTIAPPASITAADKAAVTKAELVTALDPQVQAAVEAVAAGAVKTTDYTYDVTADNGDAITTIDLTNAGVKVKVTITAAGSSTLVTGATAAIEITLPAVA